MTLAIIGSVFWVVAGLWLTVFAVFGGFMHFVIAMDQYSGAAQRKWGRRAAACWVGAALWSVLWISMAAISITNWVAAANS